MSLATAGAILVLSGLAAALYLHLVARVFRLRGARPTQHVARTRDGWEIAVYHRPAVRRLFREPVLLCHGLATNHLNLDFEPPYSLASAFAEAGFEAFSVDWRGAGRSAPPRGRGRFDFDADDLIAQDAPAVMDLVLQLSAATRLFWVGHSLGGLVGYGVLGGEAGSRIAGLCALGVPVYFRHPRWLALAMRACTTLAWPFAFRQRLLSLALAPFVGRVTLPLSDVLINPQAIAPPVLRRIYANLINSMGYRLLRQLSAWGRRDVFCSRDGSTDYRARLVHVSQPVLVLGGTQDGLANPEAIRAQAALLGTKDKTVMLFGRENGDALEYGHGDLLFGTGAPREVYPRIVRWVSERATAAEVQGEAALPAARPALEGEGR
jgi:pimeloyl-ACP methyl ester carboxylesterase